MNIRDYNLITSSIFNINVAPDATINILTSPTPPIIIVEDTDFYDVIVDINSRFIIPIGVVVRFFNSIVSIFSSRSLSDDIGFEVFGDLQFINSQVELNDATILVEGENAILRVLNGTNLNITGGSIDINEGTMFLDSSTITTDSSNISVENGNLTLYNSVFDISNSTMSINSIYNHPAVSFGSSQFIQRDSKITLQGRQPLEFDSSTWDATGVNEIVGYGLFPHPTLITEKCFQIAVRNSTVKINHNVPVSPANKMTMRNVEPRGLWYGLFIEDSESYFSNTRFESFRYIHLSGGETTIANSTIEGNYLFRTYKDNWLTITDTNYLNNTRGIYITDGSSIYADRLAIEGVSNTDGLYLDRTNHSSNFITDSVIQSNFSSGVNLYQSFLVLNNTVVQDNYVGLRSFSNVRSFVTGASQITDNQEIEVLASFAAFFDFFQCWLTSEIPIVLNRLNSNNFLLWALDGFPGGNPPIARLIRIQDISIDTSDPNRFYPSLSNFLFINNVRSSDLETDLYNEIKNHIIAKEPENAIEKVYLLIEYHPETEQARQAMAYLPMLTNAVEGCVEELIIFLSEIDHENLIHSAMKTKAMTRMFNRDFYEAVHKFENVINDYPCEIVQAISIIDQAYSYYRLYESGARNLPSISRHKPKTREEYLEIREKIMAQLLKGVINEPEPTETVPVVYKFSTRNFPNPFNPETTIQFAVSGFKSPHTHLYKGGSHVLLNVYNARGQRVRTLLDGSTEFTAGYHDVVWNGRDDSGNSVGSGVYFYRMISRDIIYGEVINEVRRMLLLK